MSEANTSSSSAQPRQMIVNFLEAFALRTIRNWFSQPEETRRGEWNKMRDYLVDTLNDAQLSERLNQLFRWLESQRENPTLIAEAIKSALISYLDGGAGIDRKTKVFEGVTLAPSDLMKGFQAAMASSTKAEEASEGGQSIKGYFIRDLEVELAVPLVVNRTFEEPLLMVPGVDSVTAESPFVKMKFNISHDAEKADE